MKLYTYGFWSGFIEKTNATHVGFFCDLFEKVFNEQIVISSSIEDSDILLETIFAEDTKLFTKQWKYTFLFSGESRLNRYSQHYTCVLWGERNNGNVVNVPLYIPYMHCSHQLGFTETNINTIKIPTKNVCAIISNPCGNERNNFLDMLEKKIHVNYAGNFRNNTTRIEDYYNTPEFIDKISEYKFIVSMENSRHCSYITEKITHGFIASTIPIYWGSTRVCDHFNDKRFINVTNTDDEYLDNIINQIESICNDDNKYKEMVSQPILQKNGVDRSIDNIARDIRNLVFPRVLSTIEQVYIISSKEFEPDRFNRLNTLFFDKLKFPRDNIKFICPTYKQTISDDIMTQFVKQELVLKLRTTRMKKSEVSLFLNYKAVLSDIERNYSNGNFLVFESDVFDLESMASLNDFLKFVKTKNNMWDIIHIGYGGEDQIFGSPYIMDRLAYRDALYGRVDTNYIEDLTSSEDYVRLIRKYHTRCTDSFVWNYCGVVKFLEHMNTDTNYGVPFDYYMINKCETDESFKHYWSTKSFFIQGSNNGMDVSTIQSDPS